MPASTHDEPSAETPRWGLLARFRRPFKASARHLADYYIQPDDPHREYKPGDIVTGEVVLKVIKPIDVTHIVINLHGFAQVYKNPNSPGTGYRDYNAALVSGKTNKAGGYYGNGFASLFEDERVLCGEGRFAEGYYRFGFELQFPTEHIPTSLDFERGTITYTISSTITRPSRASIINPVMTCERTVKFEDVIDIAQLVKPKPRIVSLEPIIPRRTRTRSRRATQDTPGEPSNGTTPLDIPARANTLASQNNDSEPPRSPGASEASFDTALSSGGAQSASESATQSHSARTTEGSRVSRNKSHVRNHVRKPITTSVELSHAGFLRGDNIEIKILISHTKQIKSLHGVIATLYRQARVDRHPALPVTIISKLGKDKDKDKDEELLPLSRTGLGGLSLSSTGSCHIFRKDLDQSFSSIIINPNTLKTEIKTNLRVPDDAFPTISTCPGAMLSFKYYVEVIIDVQGKLQALDKFLPTPNATSVAANQRAGPNNAAPGAHANMYTGWGGHPIDTEGIRREANVVKTQFEVIIGTRDSTRNANNWNITSVAGPSNAESMTEADLAHRNRSATFDDIPSTNGIGPFNRSRTFLSTHSEPCSPPIPAYESAEPPPSFFPPSPDESSLPEKERLRRAEERLLPSRPPGEAEVSESSSVPQLLLSHTPSAPSAADLQPFHFTPQPPSAAPAYTFHKHTASSSSAPQHLPGSSSAHPSDDKQELERRRLEAERSAPPADHAQSDTTAGTTPGPSVPPTDSAENEHGPSAPVLTDEDLFGFHVHSSTQGDLPRYER